MSEFIALHRINAPGTYAGAYNPGDTVTAQVVADWHLTVGVNVEATEAYQAPRPSEDGTDRAAWEAYVTGQGTTLEDARAASLAELRGMYEPPVVEPPAHDLPANASAEGMDGAGWQNATPVTAANVPTPVADPVNFPAPELPERPAESAKKADWVLWVSEVAGLHGDTEAQAWAGDESTTRADLIAWKP